jgi:hypothetical protein
MCPSAVPLRGVLGRARTAAGALLVAVVLLCLPRLLDAGEGGLHGLPLSGAEAEEFLLVARVVDRKPIGTGITGSERLTLAEGERQARAAWKTIDVHKPGQQRMENGGWEFDHRDSWKAEVAAYELDKLLGLGLVPPTVERRFDGEVGSLQLWVENAMTEDERKERKLEPPTARDRISFNYEMYKVRVFHQLTYNADFRNVRNVLVDPDLRLFAIDNSRAFRIQPDLLAPDDLVCFSRVCLARLRGLTRELLEEKLGRWLDGMQIDALLARRDKILALVEKRVEDEGQGSVLY